ncbi:hypothetical protein BDV96DRAFT_227733 [Lophiotrema nucula]|uniref:C3H1-type domain-containing protein n=1 Tax=Lophiotrema nucula TaxID=690887 RepID=A0A6A5YT26_9PLEO|nr:hypothetical protein BDV96DRAFT_227733 [Lophiotrema nucula]
MLRDSVKTSSDAPECYSHLKRARSDDVHKATGGEWVIGGEWVHRYSKDGESSAPPTWRSFRQRRPTLAADKPTLEEIREADEEDDNAAFLLSSTECCQPPVFEDPFSAQPSTPSTVFYLNVDEDPSISPFNFKSDKRPRRESEDGHHACVSKRRKIHHKDLELEGKVHTILRDSRNASKQPPRPRTQMTPGELADFASYNNIPLEAVVHGALFRGGSTVNIAMDLDALHLTQSQEQRLYIDVLGSEPPGHSPMDDIDVYNTPLHPNHFQAEAARATGLSKKSILNAPPANTMLPFEEMMDATLEEFIIYFPNHVLRWPGLALGLRHSGWDRLFHRVARMINIARGSHGYDRDHKQAEPAVCMLKVQAAIQEIEERYLLNDHDSVWGPQLSLETVRLYINRLPKHFSADTARTVTLAEAGEYVGAHEFQGRPFSKRVKAAVVAKQAANGTFDKPVLPKVRTEQQRSASEAIAAQIFGRMFSVSSQGSMDWNQGQNSEYQDSYRPQYGHQTHDHGANDSGSEYRTSHQPRDRSDASNNTWDPSQFGSSPIFQQSSARTETSDNGNLADNESEQATPKRDFSSMPCKFGRKCKKFRQGTCPFFHEPAQTPQPRQQNEDPTQGWPDSGDAVPKKQDGLCKLDLQCSKPNCTFAHHSPEGDPSVELNLDQTCKFGVKCRHGNCNRSHPSPASFNPKENHGEFHENKGHGQGQGNNGLYGNGQKRQNDHSGQNTRGGGSRGNGGNNHGRGGHQNHNNGHNGQGRGDHQNGNNGHNGQGRNNQNGSGQGRGGQQSNNNGSGRNNNNEARRGNSNNQGAGDPRGGQHNHRNGGGRGSGGPQGGQIGGGKGRGKGNGQNPKIFGTGGPQGNNRRQEDGQRPSTPQMSRNWNDGEL